MLATTDTLCVSILLTEIYGQSQKWHGRHFEDFLSSGLVTMLNLVGICHTVWV